MEFCPVGPEDLETIAVLSEQYLTHGKKIKDDIRHHRDMNGYFGVKAVENGEMIGSPLKAYSVNDVSMTFGGEGLRSVMGVIVPTDAYSLLVTTGLCCPVI